MGDVFVDEDMNINEHYGIVVWHDSSKKKSRVCIFGITEEMVDGLDCNIGDFLKCRQVHEGWKFESVEPVLETRVNDWRVEVKVPVIMCRNWAQELEMNTNVQLQNTLFSPIIGRVGIFLERECFKDGCVYEIWATNIPDELKQCKLLKEKHDIFWMMGAQTPLLVGPNFNLGTYEMLNSEFKLTPGLVIKIICSTVIIKVHKLGLCISPSIENVKRGDRVSFLPILANLGPGRSYTLAGNCLIDKPGYVKFVNDLDNEFYVKLKVSQQDYENAEYELPPYGKILDTGGLVKSSSIGCIVPVIVRFRLNVDEISVNFFLKNVDNDNAEHPNISRKTMNGTSSSTATSTSKLSQANKLKNDFGDIGEFMTGNPIKAEFSDKPQMSGSIASAMAGIPRETEVYVNGQKKNYGASDNLSDSSSVPPPPGISKPGKGSRRMEEGIGVVAAQTVDAYYVYSPCYPRDILLPKYLREFQTDSFAINVGQWIHFTVQVNNSERVSILSFEFIDQVYPTMPSYNTIMLECKITIPADYSPSAYGGTVTSEFAPVVGDQDFLIRKCHHGKTLVAVMRRTKTSIPNVFWNIEYIKF